MSKRFRKTLKNGLRLVAERHPSARSVSVAAWVGVGSAFETRANTGISHFVEHLVFKGTAERTPREIVGAIERVGGEINAFTEREDTCFHATVLAKDLPLALEVIADLVFHPLFPQEEIDRERRVLLQEWAAVRDSPEEWISDEFCRRVWKDQGVGFPVLGQPAVLRKIQRARVAAFHQAHYVPANIVVGAAGDVDFAEFEQACVRRFGAASSRGKKPKPLATRLKPARFHAFRRQERFDTDQMHWLAGFEGVPLKDAYRFDSIVLSFLFGGGMSSRLFQEVREKAGLAYTIDCDSSSHLFGGLFTFYGATAPGSFKEFMKVMRREVRKVQDTPVPIDELDDVKRQIRGAFEISWEQMDARQEFLSRQELFFGSPIELDEILRGIDRVTPQSLQEFVHRTFRADRQACFLIGPRDPGTFDCSLIA